MLRKGSWVGGPALEITPRFMNWSLTTLRRTRSYPKLFFHPYLAQRI